MCSRMLLKVMHSTIKNIIALNHLSKNNLYLNYTFKYLAYMLLVIFYLRYFLFFFCFWVWSMHANEVETKEK